MSFAHLIERSFLVRLRYTSYVFLIPLDKIANPSFFNPLFVRFKEVMILFFESMSERATQDFVVNLFQNSFVLINDKDTRY